MGKAASKSPGFFQDPIHWLFVFIPATLLLERLQNIAPPLLFFSAAFGIVPIAAYIVRATEQLAHRMGDAVGGLLNATFGNAPELIITMVALKAGHGEMVRAAIVGGILANLILALGVSFLVGGLRYHTQKFNPTATRAYSTMMFLATISLMVPSGFSRYFSSTGSLPIESTLNLWVAGALLTTYGLYLVFSLKTHPKEFASIEGSAHGDHEGPPWKVAAAIAVLLGASVGAAIMSEALVGAAEGTGRALGMSELFIGIVIVSIVGGAAESGSAIAMARKNKIDLSVGILLGSCIQIALFIAPVLLFASYFIGPAPLELAFSRAEIGSLLMSVVLGTVVCGDGTANWFKGVQLIMMYFFMALLFYFIPA